MSQHDGPRAAIVGAGLMGRWHADAVRRIGGRVTVIVDPDPRARAALGKSHPHARLEGDLDPSQLARDATAAHVCTPLDSHVEIATRLVASGVHAIVEKPLASTSAETTRVLDLASARGVIVCPVHQFPFQVGVRRIKEWLPSFGVLRRLEFSTCSAGASLADPAALDRLIAEILPHPLSLVWAVLGVPTAEVPWHTTHPSAGELRAVGVIGPTIVDVSISGHGRPTENTLRVIGDAGSATADLFHGFAVKHNGDVSRRAKIARPFVAAGASLAVATVNLARRAIAAEPAYPGLRELIRRFYRSTNGNGPAPVPQNEAIDIAISRDRLVAAMHADSPLRDI